MLHDTLRSHDRAFRSVGAKPVRTQNKGSTRTGQETCYGQDKRRPPILKSGYAARKKWLRPCTIQYGPQPEGEALRSFLDSQTHLITSIPLQVAQEVQKMALEAYVSGERGQAIIDRLREIANLTLAEAQRIARTEVSRTSTGLTQVRAESVGSRATFGAQQVTDVSARSIGGLRTGFFRWDRPPIAARDGTRAHPGCIYKCRCYPEPVLPDVPAVSRFKAEAV